MGEVNSADSNNLRQISKKILLDQYSTNKSVTDCDLNKNLHNCARNFNNTEEIVTAKVRRRLDGQDLRLSYNHQVPNSYKNRNRQSQKRPYLTRQSECCNDQHDNQTPCQRKIRRRHEQTNCIRGHLIQNKNKSINFNSKHIKNQRRLSKSNPNRINEIGSNICDLRKKFVRNNSESKIFITSKNREISSALSLRNKNSDSILQRHLGSFDSKRSTSGKRIRTYTDPSQYCRPIREGNRTVYEHLLTLQKTNYQKNLVVKPSTLRRASSSSFIYLGNHKAKKDILFEEFSQFLKKRSNNMANIQNNPVRTTCNSPQIQPVLDFMNNRKAYP